MTRGIGLLEEQNTFRKNRFAAAASRLAVRQEIDGLARGVHGSIKILLLAFHLYIGFIHAVTLVGGLQMRATSLV